MKSSPKPRQQRRNGGLDPEYPSTEADGLKADLPERLHLSFYKASIGAYGKDYRFVGAWRVRFRCAGVGDEGESILHERGEFLPYEGGK